MRISDWSSDVCSSDRALPRLDVVDESAAASRFGERCFSPVPELVGSCLLDRACRVRHLVVGKAELAIDEVKKRCEASQFTCHLIRRAKDIGVVYLKPVDAYDAVYLPRRLRAMACYSFEER